MIKLQAHRGVSTEAPENTLPAIELAAHQAYPIAEVDVSVTKDGKFVLLHDDSINRTARLKGAAPGEPLRISDITYEEALAYDFGSWFSKKYEGTPIPLFEDILKYAREAGIKGWESYLRAYRAEGCHAVHHSEAYRAAEAPAYRVVSARFLQSERVCRDRGVLCSQCDVRCRHPKPHRGHFPVDTFY